MSSVSLENLILIQAQIAEFRRLAASGNCSAEVARQLTSMAERLEAVARAADAEALD